MKAKIDLEKFICSMLNDSKTNAGYVHAKSIERALKEQGMEYKDGEIVDIEQEDLRKRYERIGNSDWFKKTHEGMSITIPDNLKGTDPDGGVVGEKGEKGEPETLEEKVKHWQRMHDIAMEKIKGEFKEEDSPETKAIKEQIENLKKRIEDNQLGCIVQRLDKIIELLQEAILILPKEPYVPPIITTANTFGSDYDIDIDKIKQDETNKPES